MTRKKVKLSWVVNESSRVMSLKKRRLGLIKKVRELTILCDVKACMVIFSPNEIEPMVWPSIEAARSLLDDFFSLPDIEKKKKEMTLELYLKEKTKKVDEQLKKIRKKNNEYMVDQLMVQLHRGRRIVDLNLIEIYDLLSFSRDKIMLCRKRLDSVQHPPLRDPPMHLFLEMQSQEIRNTMSDTFPRGNPNDERVENDEAMQRISIDAIRNNQSHYLMDQWFFMSPEPPKPSIHQQIRMNMLHQNENPNRRSYLPYQGSSSNGNPNLEMEPIGQQVMTFHDPRMNMSNGAQGLHQETPPNGTIFEEGNVGAMSLDINRGWMGTNNNPF